MYFSYIAGSLGVPLIVPEGGPLGAKARQHLWTEYQATDGKGAAASGGTLTLDMLDF